MWGVGPATRARLAEIDVHTIGQLARMPGRSLERLLGRAAGEKLTALAWNRDPREIKTHRRAHSAGAQSALGKQACGRASFSTHAASSCGQGRHPAAGQISARPNRDGPRSLCRSPLGHPLGNTRCADFGDCDAC